ncbi:hypothetical protein DPMN_109916 [Dreissena polymorpha]|uniref:Uncharacterized protein n=1 Tax=Dreissena polymorpha TaxID=45954 RepID=A0A9D4KBM8_DREPO|nr:hypothetical protein DPMN_109916 [Dreissena polymorpha]
MVFLIFPQHKRSSGELQKVDWHDHKQIAADEARVGPGEQGAAVILSPEEESKKDDLYKVNGFNAFASDMISLQRSIKDIRHPEYVCNCVLYVLFACCVL